MSRVALLDVNLLVALFAPGHVHHELAHDWFAEHREVGWATCPVTENGFVRVVTNPASGLGDHRAEDVVARLRTFAASGGHTFWPAAVSLTDRRVFDPRFVRGHRQLTDIYLLGLARHSGGALATFDRTIPLAAVAGATRSHLLVITASDDDQ